MQYTKPYKLVQRFRVLANEYCSPANFDCDSGFREYFLFNSFAEHRSSTLQLSLDCLVQYIDRKFNNQFSLQYEFLHYLTMWPRQHKQKSQVQNLPCRSSIKQQRYVCIIVTGFVPRLWVMTLWKIFAVDTQFKQLRKRSLKKIQASAGFEPVTSAIPVQCSTNRAMKP